jgi:hypothetical protein
MIGRDSLYRLQTRRTSAQDGVLQNFSEREAASAPFARSTASMQGPRPCRFSSLQLNGRDFFRRCDVSCLNFAQFAQQAGNLRWQPLYRCRAVPSQNLILATPDGAYELELRTLRKTTHLQGRSATSFRRRYIFGRRPHPIVDLAQSPGQPRTGCCHHRHVYRAFGNFPAAILMLILT